jgi:hypothetical protein
MKAPDGHLSGAFARCQAVYGRVNRAFACLNGVFIRLKAPGTHPTRAFSHCQSVFGRVNRAFTCLNREFIRLKAPSKRLSGDFTRCQAVCGCVNRAFTCLNTHNIRLHTPKRGILLRFTSLPRKLPPLQGRYCAEAEVRAARTGTETCPIQEMFPCIRPVTTSQQGAAYTKGLWQEQVIISLLLFPRQGAMINADR